MSIKIVNGVWDHSQHSCGNLLILLALADFSNEDGVCFASIDQLSKKARVSEKHARHIVRTLVNSGELEVTLNKTARGTVQGFRVLIAPGTSAPATATTPVAEPDRSQTEIVLDEPPPLLTFPTIGRQQTWHLIQKKVDEYQQTFPQVDVMSECRKALQWVIDNPSRRKTQRGMPKFLFGWMNNASRSGSFTPSPAIALPKYLRDQMAAGIKFEVPHDTTIARGTDATA